MKFSISGRSLVTTWKLRRTWILAIGFRWYGWGYVKAWELSCRRVGPLCLITTKPLYVSGVIDW